MCSTPLDLAIEAILPRDFVNEIDVKKCTAVLKSLIEEHKNNINGITSRKFKMVCNSHKFTCRKNQLHYVFRHNKKLQESLSDDEVSSLQKFLVSHNRNHDGITTIAILTGEQKSSCKYDCSYCPDYQPDQATNETIIEYEKDKRYVDAKDKTPYDKVPRSYLPNEPAVRRAINNKFDIVDQFLNRSQTLLLNGNWVDKIEVLVLGGTFSCYSRTYQRQVVRDVYYSANVLYSKTSPYDEFRPAKTMEEEIELNGRSGNQCKIIGLTLETRPEFSRKHELMWLRQLSCTRMQIGMQHYDDTVLAMNNRESTFQTYLNGLESALNAGYKITTHVMLNMYGSTPEMDKKLIDISVSLNLDSVKIYPTLVLDHTQIKKWYEQGIYVPYSQKQVIKNVVYFKQLLKRMTRTERIYRDFPSEYNASKEHDMPHMGAHVIDIMENKQIGCQCIRCRQIRNKKVAKKYKDDLGLIHQYKFKSFGSDEYFITMDTHDDKYLLGMLRLRLIPLNKGKWTFPFLTDHALIRELHVHGYTTHSFVSNTPSSSIITMQHKGMGKRLMRKAEEIAYENGYRKIAVIAGVGVRDYYRKLGYKLQDTYMIKKLRKDDFEGLMLYWNKEKIINIGSNHHKTIYTIGDLFLGTFIWLLIILIVCYFALANPL